MKAVVVTDEAAGMVGMTLVQRPQPRAAINDAVVEVHASGFVPTEMAWPSTWVDRRGRDRAPSILGHELAGVVTALGYGTTGVSVGQRVLGLADWHRDGTLAEYDAIEARNLAPLPGDVDFTAGASLPISGLTAWQGLFGHGHLQAGQSVLAHGAAGAVGTMVTQLAREAGAYVIGTGRAADRRKALDFGAQEFVDLDNDTLEDVGGDIQKRSASLIRARGTLVTVVGPPEARPADGLAIDFVVESDRTQLSEIVQRLRDGRLQTNIGNVTTLDDAVAALNPTERHTGKRSSARAHNDSETRAASSGVRLRFWANGRCKPTRGPTLASLRDGYHERGAVAGSVRNGWSAGGLGVGCFRGQAEEPRPAERRAREVLAGRIPRGRVGRSACRPVSGDNDARMTDRRFCLSPGPQQLGSHHLSHRRRKAHMSHINDTYADPTQGHTIGHQSYDDPTQGEQVGEDPKEDPTQPRQNGNRTSYNESDLTGPGAGRTVDSPDGAPRDTIDEWGVFASTTEALTLTILTELVRRAGEHPEVPSSVAAIVGGVYAAELDHWRFTSKHWEPATTRFWIPDGLYGGEGDALDLTAVGKGVAAGEHLFVNTYLLGVTTFAAAGNSTYARYAAEIAANESEHRLLGQTLAGVSPPNDLGFADYEFDRIGEIAAAAQSAGFGFGEQGTAAGRFYDLPQSPMDPPIQISSNEPR